MRPPSNPQGALHYPLSHLLTGEAAVRVLRELSRHGGELAPVALAQRTGLTSQTVRRTLDRAAGVGLVDRLGPGRYPSYRLTAIHPLRAPLDALFTAEADRVARVYEALRRAARQLAPPPLSIWVYGSVARSQDQPGSDLDVALVAADEAVEGTVEAFRDAAVPALDTEKVPLSVVGLSPADVRRLAPRDPFWQALERDAYPLVGAAPAILRARLRDGNTSPTPLGPPPPKARGRRRRA